MRGLDALRHARDGAWLEGAPLQALLRPTALLPLGEFQRVGPNERAAVPVVSSRERDAQVLERLVVVVGVQRQELDGRVQVTAAAPGAKNVNVVLSVLEMGLPHTHTNWGGSRYATWIASPFPEHVSGGDVIPAAHAVSETPHDPGGEMMGAAFWFRPCSTFVDVVLEGHGMSRSWKFREGVPGKHAVGAEQSTTSQSKEVHHAYLV